VARRETIGLSPKTALDGRRGNLNHEMGLRRGQSWCGRSTEGNQVITTRRSRLERGIQALDWRHDPLRLMENILDTRRRIGSLQSVLGSRRNNGRRRQALRGTNCATVIFKPNRRPSFGSRAGVETKSDFVVFGVVRLVEKHNTEKKKWRWISSARKHPALLPYRGRGFPERECACSPIDDRRHFVRWWTLSGGSDYDR
jgi:hypothetical protein